MGHDSTAAILEDGKIKAAISEERFSRIKHDGGFPSKAIQYCLEEVGVRMSDVDKIAVGFGLNPENIKRGSQHKFSCLAKSDSRFRKTSMEEKNPIFYNHQYIHTRTGYSMTDFSKAVALSLDGRGIDNGESSSGGIFIINNGEIEPIKIFPGIASLGFAYGLLTEVCGFRMIDGEGKTMSLAAYGENETNEEKEMVYNHVKKIFPKFKGIEYSEGGVSDPFYHVKDNVIRFANTDTRVNLIGKIFKKELIAWAAQKVLEDIVTKLVIDIVDHTGIKNLILTGGVFSNMILNMKIRDKLGKKYKVFFNPICNDHGNAVGAAIEQYIVETGKNLSFPNMSLYLGPSYLDEEIQGAIKKINLKFEKIDKIQKATELIKQGKIIGWFQGRSELGPRGLGNRSILSLTNDIKYKDIVNQKIKKRESWRPFCPTIIDKRSSELLKNSCEAPYMISGFEMKEFSNHPAVCHIDGTCRPQILNQYDNPEFYNLVKQSDGIVLNTSFNLSGDPIVETPTDALITFKNSDMDALIMNDFLVQRN